MSRPLHCTAADLCTSLAPVVVRGPPALCTPVQSVGAPSSCAALWSITSLSLKSLCNVCFLPQLASTCPQQQGGEPNRCMKKNCSLRLHLEMVCLPYWSREVLQ